MEDLFHKETVKKISAKDELINKAGNNIGKMIGNIHLLIPVILLILILGIVYLIIYSVQFWFVSLPAFSIYAFYIYKKLSKKK